MTSLTMVQVEHANVCMLTVLTPIALFARCQECCRSIPFALTTISVRIKPTYQNLLCGFEERLNLQYDLEED